MKKRKRRPKRKWMVVVRIHSKKCNLLTYPRIWAQHRLPWRNIIHVDGLDIVGCGHRTSAFGIGAF